ncbi:MAG: A/G-specific adenine glycosylase [Oscillospiraceae bacterium]|jgi:A/G-specific adenine glycosylase|nr:A/G-specific adenine glycosylase [Oscillospiraceae bacterium]
MNEALARLLLAWYDANGRSLPWRGAGDAYCVWVSEVMLQQTRAEAVKAYYERFLAALPTVQALADVDEDKLFKLWEGLGYYSRARNLRRAARMVTDAYGGVIPAAPEDLLRLPGVGLYTAGAVASIAYNVCIPAVDGNALRVCKRLEADCADITLEQTKKATAARLLAVMPQDRPGAFNQAMMDLGAMICLPGGAARCGECPLAQGCAALAQGTVAELPVKSAARPRKLEGRVVLRLECEDRVALRKRPGKGLLAGLWEFPNAIAVAGEEPPWLPLLTSLGAAREQVAVAAFMGEAKHIFTHIEWHMQGWRLELARIIENPALVWATRRELQATYALPSALSAFL